MILDRFVKCTVPSAYAHVRGETRIASPIELQEVRPGATKRYPVPPLFPLTHSSNRLLMASEAQPQVYYVFKGFNGGNINADFENVPAIYYPAHRTVVVNTGDLQVIVYLDTPPRFTFDQESVDASESTRRHAAIHLNNIWHNGVCFIHDGELRIDCIIDENAPGYNNTGRRFWMSIIFPREVSLGETPCSSSSTPPAV